MNERFIVSDTAIDIAAKAMWDADEKYGGSSWEHSSTSITDEFREKARIALEAVHEALASLPF